MRRGLLSLSSLAVVLTAVGVIYAQVAVKDDPLVRMPGSQPAPEGNVNLEAPTRCLNCHAGYNTAVEPGHNWKGSMMAQSARDFLFYACLTTAAQDTQHVVGSPNATDICLRCHFPKGWLEGRSDPTNGTAMTGADFDGVQCDFCHRSYDPFFETTFSGEREGSDWTGYWDETNASGTPSDVAALATYGADDAESATVKTFNGGDFFDAGNLPPVGYDESGSGQYFVSSTRDKRASFADADAKHGMYYSRYHKSKYFCGTCHDVSNPVLQNLGADPTLQLPTETDSAYAYFHVERTFSEFMLSAYGRDGGAPGEGPFAPDLFTTSNPGGVIAKCQDCHMRDVVGPGCDKAGAPIRPNESIEHPQSGQPLHDLTGGNAWVSWVLASSVAGSPVYDPVNHSLLNQGAGILTLDLNQGEGIDAVALLDGVLRAKEQLQLAAAVTDATYNSSNGHLSFRVRNQTGHKLISGFPEGRRMFVNIQARDADGNVIFEVNPYDSAAGTLQGLTLFSYYDPDGELPEPQPLAANQIYLDEIVYEAHPSSSLTGESKTFHFALATDRYKDNRIPPKGFDIASAEARLAHPRWHGTDALDYFTAEEYAGGYDEASVNIGPGAAYVDINLYYQTTSREYIEFLRDEINGYPAPNPKTPTLPAEAYVAQSDPFYTQLAAWGDTIWALWKHNRDVDGATPFLMAQATVGTAPPPCAAVIPQLLSAVPASNQVTLGWSDVTGELGYRIYYNQAGKGQQHAEVGADVTTYTDTGLSNGVEYCYKVSSYNATCESDFSNVLCATPSAPGQEVFAGVNQLQTGSLVTTGKGKDKITVFEPGDLFNAGDTIVVRAWAVDTDTAAPLTNATVEITISGLETVVLSAVSDATGLAEVTWQTQAPNKRGQGGTTPGSYTAAVTNVSVAGYTWDGVMTSATFTLQ